MYYIVKETESKMHYIKEVKNSTNETFSKLSKDGFDVKMSFSEKHQAKHWVDWFNGDVSHKDHENFMLKKIK